MTKLKSDFGDLPKEDKYKNVPFSSAWQDIPPRDVAVQLYLYGAQLLSKITSQDVLFYVKRERERSLNIGYVSSLLGEFNLFSFF